MKQDLQTIKDALEDSQRLMQGEANTILTGEPIRGGNVVVAKNKVEQVLKSLANIQERLDSEELLKDLIKRIGKLVKGMEKIDTSTICSKDTEVYMHSKLIAQAIIAVIKGE